MESFTLLKYWRTSAAPTSAVSQPSSDQTSGDDDGPFFDLEFALPQKDQETNEEEEEEESEVVLSTSDDDEDEDREFKFTLSSGSSNDHGDNNSSLSPSDELFFKGRLVPVISESESEPKPQFSLLKSATKLRVLMLRFKKTKAEQSPAAKTHGAIGSDDIAASPDESSKKSFTESEIPHLKKTKLLTVRFKVEEFPILSLFKDNAKNGKTKTGNDEDSVSDSVMNKYLKKMKPLYVRVSKKYAEKLKFSSSASQPTPVAEKVEVKEGGEVAASAGKTGQKQGNIPSGLRVVCKHLGKSKSASSATVAAAPSGGATPAASNRRDDSFLHEQDGIQSAILHCKRSFNASRDNESLLLSRSVSDPSHEKSPGFSVKKQAEGKASGVAEENPKKAGNVA